MTGLLDEDRLVERKLDGTSCSSPRMRFALRSAATAAVAAAISQTTVGGTDLGAAGHAQSLRLDLCHPGCPFQ